MILVSTVLTVSRAVSESESTASGASTDISKTAIIQYKPITSLAGNNTLAHYEQSCGFKYHMHYPIFMACTGAAVIFLTSYPYTV